MVNNKTALIIGAGASKEAGMPVGSELKNRIAELLNIRFKDLFRMVSGDPTIYEALKSHIRNPDTSQKDINVYLHACWRICDAMPQAPSIDAFIENHRDNEMIAFLGKLAIVYSILEMEKNSLLFSDRAQGVPAPKFGDLEGTWYGRFLMLLLQGCSVDELRERLASLTLIIFNYDRCIEQFLYCSFQNYCGVNERLAADMVKSIAIYHPYGAVGNLPWQQPEKSIAFGARVNGNQLLQLTSQIKTFTEGTDRKSSNITEIWAKIIESTMYVFLGFAFHNQNLELLNPNAVGRPHRGGSCYATGYGISKSDCSAISIDLSNMLGCDMGETHIEDGVTCFELFHAYSRRLGLSFRPT